MAIGFSLTLIPTHGYRPVRRPLGVSVTRIIATLGFFKIGLRPWPPHASIAAVSASRVNFFDWATCLSCASSRLEPPCRASVTLTSDWA